MEFDESHGLGDISEESYFYKDKKKTHSNGPKKPLNFTEPLPLNRPF